MAVNFRSQPLGVRGAALLVATALVIALVPPASASASGSVPVMAQPLLDEDQLIAWWESRVPSRVCNKSEWRDGVWRCLETVDYSFRAAGGTITPRQLVRTYLEEGKRQGVMSDVAFMQAVLETAWFYFPDSGQVRPTQNNFAGMGAFDGSDGSKVFTFSSPSDGVRAQLQHLRIYGDPTVDSGGSNLGVPLVVNEDATDTWNYPDRWRTVRNGSGPLGPYHASATTWNDFGSGLWATDPGYSKKILDLYRGALVASGLPADAAARSTWILRDTASKSSTTAKAAYGYDDSLPVSCDWNGDGQDTPGSFRDGLWSFTNDTQGVGGTAEFRFGTAGDIPLCGDWDGDGIDTIGLWRDREWLLRNTNSRGHVDTRFHYGKPTDTPLVGDFNGNGQDTIGVHRGREWILRSRPGAGPADIRFHYGRSTDTPLIGDFNGNGQDTHGVHRDREWILRSRPGAGPADIRFHYGRSTDTPLIGDFNGNGHDTVAVVR